MWKMLCRIPASQPSNSTLPSSIGEEPDCKDITAKLQYVKVGDCKSQEEVDIHYCQVRLWNFKKTWERKGKVSLVVI